MNKIILIGIVFPLFSISHEHAMEKTSLVHKQVPYGWKNKHIELTHIVDFNQMIHDGTVIAPGIQSLGYTWDGNIKVFHLIAQPIEQFIVDGTDAEYAHLIPEHNHVAFGMKMPKKIQKLRAWGFNGSTPGPVIEAYEGDTIRVIVKNELPEPMSVHWHGLEVPNHFDGATPETNRPIMPSETFTYEFTLYQSGTLMYHSGFNVMKQDNYGLHGMLIIHPKKYEKKIDKDFAIFLQQWALEPGNANPNLTTNMFNWFTFNGKAAPKIPTLTVKQYEHVRIRFANIGMGDHPIHIHGYVWENVGTEGGPIQSSARTKGSTVMVSAGTTRDVEFTAWNPGLWRLHCHKLHHVVNAHTDMPMGVMDHGGMFTLIHVIPEDEQAQWRHPRQKRLQKKRVMPATIPLVQINKESPDKKEDSDNE